VVRLQVSWPFLYAGVWKDRGLLILF
jgi:hypothetical protein